MSWQWLPQRIGVSSPPLVQAKKAYIIRIHSKKNWQTFNKITFYCRPGLAVLIQLLIPCSSLPGQITSVLFVPTILFLARYSLGIWFEGALCMYLCMWLHVCFRQIAGASWLSYFFIALYYSSASSVSSISVSFIDVNHTLKRPLWIQKVHIDLQHKLFFFAYYSWGFSVAGFT